MQIVVLAYMAALRVHVYALNDCSEVMLTEQRCWICSPAEPLPLSVGGGKMPLPAFVSPGVSGQTVVSVNHKAWSKSEEGESATGRESKKAVHRLHGSGMLPRGSLPRMCWRSCPLLFALSARGTTPRCCPAALQLTLPPGRTPERPRCCPL